jgi:hypothetical protein
MEYQKCYLQRTTHNYSLFPNDERVMKVNSNNYKQQQIKSVKLSETQISLILRAIQHHLKLLHYIMNQLLHLESHILCLILKQKHHKQQLKYGQLSDRRHSSKCDKLSEHQSYTKPDSYMSRNSNHYKANGQLIQKIFINQCHAETRLAIKSHVSCLLTGHAQTTLSTVQRWPTNDSC